MFETGPERRVSDSAVHQIVSLWRHGASERWALEVTIRALQERATYTGELVCAGLTLGGVGVPVLLLSPRGIFVFDASVGYARSAKWPRLQEATAAVRQAIPGYPAEIRSAVVLCDQEYPPEEFFHANGVSGVQVGSRSIGQFIDLFDDPGPLPGDLAAIRAGLAEPAQ